MLYGDCSTWWLHKQEAKGRHGSCPVYLQDFRISWSLVVLIQWRMQEKPLIGLLCEIFHVSLSNIKDHWCDLCTRIQHKK